MTIAIVGALVVAGVWLTMMPHEKNPEHKRGEFTPPLKETLFAAPFTGSSAAAPSELSHNQRPLTVALNVHSGGEALQSDVLSDTLLVISTSNNINNTVRFIDSLKASNDEFDLLVVDNRSEDGTPEILKRMGVRVITKDGEFGLAQSWNLGYGVFKEGHQKHGQYKNMIVATMRASTTFSRTAPDFHGVSRPVLLAGDGGVEMTRQALLQHPFVVPMTTVVGHNPSQSIEVIHNLDELGSAYVNDRRNYKRVQAGLTARAAESGLSFTAFDTFDGFFFAVRAPEIFKAEYAPGMLFDTDSTMSVQGGDLVDRLEPYGITPMISHDIFVSHEKSVTQEAANVDPTTSGLAPSILVVLVMPNPAQATVMRDIISRGLGWTVRVLEESEWYNLRGVDVLITGLPEYDLTQIANEKSTLVKIAWPTAPKVEIGEGMLMRWVEKRGFGLYDLILSTSERDKRVLEAMQPFSSVCTFRCPPILGGELPAEKLEKIQQSTGDRWRKNRMKTKVKKKKKSKKGRTRTLASVESGFMFVDERYLPIEVFSNEHYNTLAQQLYEAMEKHGIVPIHAHVDFARQQSELEMQVHRAPCRICVIVNAHPSQAEGLSGPLLSLMQQKRDVNEVSVRLFLANTDPVTYQETGFMSDFAADVNAKAGYKAVAVLEAISQPLDHAHGYDIVDIVLDDLLETSDCTHLVFTEGCSTYEEHVFDDIAGAVQSGNDVIELRYGRFNSMLHKTSAKFLPKATLVNRQVIEQTGARFLPHGIFTSMVGRNSSFFGSLRRKQKLRTLLLISTCNHVGYTVKFVESLKAVSDDFDLLVVDDHSVDGTPEILTRMGVRVITKDLGLGLTHSWNLAYGIFKKGYRQGLYTNMIVANNDLLVGEGGVDLVRQALLQHPFVVPMSTTLGVGHNPAQSISAVHKLDEGETLYVNEYGNHKRVQAGLKARAAVLGLSFTPSPNKFNGFFFAFRAPDIFRAEYAPGVLFDTDSIMVGQENTLIKRLKLQGITPMISHDIFVFHFKSVTVKAAGYVSGSGNETREDISHYHPELKGSSGNVTFAQQFAAGVLNADVLNQGSATLGSGSSMVLAFAISDPIESPAAGDIMTAHEFGDSVERVLGWTVRYLGQPDWYDLRGVDMVIAMLPQYNPLKIIYKKSTLVKIAWPHDWSSRRANENPGFGLFDLILSSSEKGKTYLEAQQPFDAVCTFRCVSPMLINDAQNSMAMQLLSTPGSPVSHGSAHSKIMLSPHHVPVEILRIATNADNRINHNDHTYDVRARELYEGVEKHGMVPMQGRRNLEQASSERERKVHSAPHRVCAIMRTYPGQANLLGIPLLSLTQQQYLQSNDDISVRVFLMNTDPVAYKETTFMTEVASVVNTAAGYEAVLVMEASSSPSWAHAYGYDATDTMLDRLLDASDCTHFLFTNGDNFYNNEWLTRIAGAVKAGKLMVAWDFTTHHKRGHNMITVKFQRKFVDLGAVLVDRWGIERTGARFVPRGPFTDDFFARDWWFFEKIYDLAGEEGIAYEHQVLFMHQ
jgi:GT2 family glycosyltransferase